MIKLFVSLEFWNFPLQFLLAFSVINHKPTRWGRYVFPAWANALGWFLASLSLLSFFLDFIPRFLKQEGNIMLVGVFLQLHSRSIRSIRSISVASNLCGFLIYQPICISIVRAKINENI